MNTSIMQNALGVFQQDCQNLRYEDNNLVLEIQTPKENFVVLYVEVIISIVAAAIFVAL